MRSGAEHRGFFGPFELTPVKTSGANVLARWTRALDDGADFKLQAYLSRSERKDALLYQPHEDIAEMGRIPYDIIYEDDSMFVVSKPPHLIVHPTGGYRYLTLLNALHLRFQPQGFAPRLVNRIDKETSGLVICGKTADITGELGKALEDKTVVKDYLALVEGAVEQDHQFSQPLGIA